MLRNVPLPCDCNVSSCCLRDLRPEASHVSASGVLQLASESGTLFNSARVFVCDTTFFQVRVCWKMSQKISCQFPGEPASSRQSIQYFISKMKTRESLLDKKPDRKVTERNWR